MKLPHTEDEGCHHAWTATTADHTHPTSTQDARAPGAAGDLRSETRAWRSHRPGRCGRRQQRADRPEARDKPGDLPPMARRVWLENEERLSAAKEASERDLRRAIEQTLCDRPRSGAPPTFTAEQVCQIVAMACEAPSQESGRPVTHWSTTELAEEAVKRGIVKEISARSVGRFLKGGRSEAPPGGAVEAQ
jgi:Homeodomain-like domain